MFCCRGFLGRLRYDCMCCFVALLLVVFRGGFAFDGGVGGSWWWLVWFVGVVCA